LAFVIIECNLLGVAWPDDLHFGLSHKPEDRHKLDYGEGNGEYHPKSQAQANQKEVEDDRIYISPISQTADKQPKPNGTKKTKQTAERMVTAGD
jgi:hypothetical protein